jgi:hypothetical protein
MSFYMLLVIRRSGVAVQIVQISENMLLGASDSLPFQQTSSPWMNFTTAVGRKDPVATAATQGCTVRLSLQTHHDERAYRSAAHPCPHP